MYLNVGPQDARAVANYFLDLAKTGGRTIDPMGIQKFVYFAHGWNLALNDRPLIAQRIEAWDYGPVIRDLYYEFKRFGNGPITQPAMELNVEPGTTRVRFTKSELTSAVPKETLSLLDRVWEVYRPFTSIQLSNLTHTPGSPWSRARESGQEVIDDGVIRDYFRSPAANR
jgi:uncharacterized phage-associated protein